MEKAKELSQIIDAFLPEPLDTSDELKEFYCDTSNARNEDEYSNFSKEMLIKLKNCKNGYIHTLFVGHTGSGKSTELYNLKEKTLKEKFFTCLGRCDCELDIMNIEYIDILFYILEILVSQAKQTGLDIDSKCLDRISSYWNSFKEIEEIEKEEAEIGVEAEVSTKSGIFEIISLLARVKSIFKNTVETRNILRRNVEPKISELINQIKEVVIQIKEQLKKKNYLNTSPIVILDGIDKVSHELAIKIFRDNGMKFADLPIHLVISFPIALTYMPEYNMILSWFSSVRLPMIKLRKWTNGAYDDYPAGINTIREIIEKRVDMALFEPDVVDRLINLTGGCIRDLFACIRDAAVRAQMREAEKINNDDAAKILNTLKSEINGRYFKEDIPELDKIYHGKKFVEDNKSITRLLQAGAVIEYNTTRWCDLHPLVEEWLLEHNRIQHN